MLMKQNVNNDVTKDSPISLYFHDHDFFMEMTIDW